MNDDTIGDDDDFVKNSDDNDTWNNNTVYDDDLVFDGDGDLILIGEDL